VRAADPGAVARFTACRALGGSRGAVVSSCGGWRARGGSPAAAPWRRPPR